MTLDQLRKFANSSAGWITQIALTREAARAIIAEHDAEVAKNQEPAFEIIDRDGPPHRIMREERYARMDGRGCL